MGAIPSGLDIRIQGSHLCSRGEPQGLPLDREDAPQLVREIDTLCATLRCRKPRQIRFTAEFAMRVFQHRGWLNRRRGHTLALGWPLMQLLDADELRVALALALLGETVTTGVSPIGTDDPRIADVFGKPLLVRTLTRLLAAEALGAEHWFAAMNLAACNEPEPPREAFDQLRQGLLQSGRGGWQPALDRALQLPMATARILPLGAPQLEGGSHRSAALAWCWEGLSSRLWTLLEGPFVQLLSTRWKARHQAQSAARARVRELETRRREGSIAAPELIELARTVEQIAGARAAYPLYRQAYARERSPQLALALARTMASIDLPQARIALAHLAGSSHALASEAELLLRNLPDIHPAEPPAQATTAPESEDHDHRSQPD